LDNLSKFFKPYIFASQHDFLPFRRSLDQGGNAKEFPAFKKILPHSDKMSRKAIGLLSILENIASH
jgi:hypothetical protein